MLGMGECDELDCASALKQKKKMKPPVNDLKLKKSRLEGQGLSLQPECGVWPEFDSN